MSNRPRFSVVLPTHNRAERCLQAIGSVRNQTDPSWELIVVDDGSTDGTGDRVRAIDDPRVVYLCQVNSGAAAARNRGIDTARGDYVCFLDSDDEYLPEHLETLARAIDAAGPDTGFYFTGSYVQRGDVRSPRPEPHWSEPVPLMLGRLPDTPCICIERSLLASDRFDPRIRKHEDAELWTRVARNTRVMKIPALTVVIHVHSGPRMTSGTSDHFRAMRDTYQHIENTLDQRSPLPRAVLRRKWTEIYLGFLECAVHDPDLDFVNLAHEGYARTAGGILWSRRFWRAAWSKIRSG